MSSNISIDYGLAGTDAAATIQLLYTVEINEGELSIGCLVEATKPHLLSWLQLRRFQIKSVFLDGAYFPLFNHENDVKTVDTALFIDVAYKAIMGKEKLLLHADAFPEA